jgi:hypothetical protein
VWCACLQGSSGEGQEDDEESEEEEEDSEEDESAEEVSDSPIQVCAEQAVARLSWAGCRGGTELAQYGASEHATPVRVWGTQCGAPALPPWALAVQYSSQPHHRSPASSTAAN